VAASVFIEDGEYLALGTKEYRIDSRNVTIPATGGRIVRHRPVLDKWTVEFTLAYDETLISDQELREVVDATGSRVGVLEFRPERKGSFGRFRVTGWK